MSQPSLLVVGGGSFGTTLAHVAASAGRPVKLWSRDPEVARSINEHHKNPRYYPDKPLAPSLTATTDLAAAARGTSVIVVAVASSGFREVSRALGDVVTGDQVLLSATKGLEPATKKRMSEILKEETCSKKVGAISGPNIARELLENQPGATVIASRFREAIELGARVFHGPRFRVYGNDDVAGVELAGALKNVIAIASGIATGMGLGDNARSLLITRGLAEVQRLGMKLGADPHTFIGLAGMGDMIVTCSSPHSRNHRVGAALAKGETLDHILEKLGEVAEGVVTAKVARDLAKENDVPLPICETVHRLLYEGLTVKEALEDLMSRRARYEIDFDYTEEVVKTRS